MQVGERIRSHGNVHVSHLLVVDTRRGKYVITHAGFSSEQTGAVAEYVRYENQGEGSGSGREGLEPKGPVHYETEVGMRVVSAVCENSEAPVKGLTPYPHETKVVRKNYVSVKHAHAEKPVIVIYRLITCQNSTVEAVARPEIGQHHAVILANRTTEKVRSLPTPYHVARHVNLSPHGNRVA